MNPGLPAEIALLLFGGLLFRQSFKYSALDLGHISVCFLGSLKRRKSAEAEIGPSDPRKKRQVRNSFYFLKQDLMYQKGLEASFLLFGFLVHSALQRLYCAQMKETALPRRTSGFQSQLHGILRHGQWS